MTNLKQDVAAALIELAASGEGGLAAVFIFPADLEIFAGHFPGRPIVPGILELEMVRAAMERSTGLPLRLLSVEKAKFLREVKPGDKISLDITFSASGDKFTVKAKSLVAEEKAALVELTLTSGL